MHTSALITLVNMAVNSTSLIRFLVALALSHLATLPSMAYFGGRLLWIHRMIRTSYSVGSATQITNVARWSRPKPILVIFFTEESPPSVCQQLDT